MTFHLEKVEKGHHKFVGQEYDSARENARAVRKVCGFELSSLSARLMTLAVTPL
jgi:hypothetical protein